MLFDACNLVLLEPPKTPCDCSFAHTLIRKSLEPPLNDDFALGEEADRFLALGMKYAEEGVLLPLKGKKATGAMMPTLMPTLPLAILY